MPRDPEALAALAVALLIPLAVALLGLRLARAELRGGYRERPRPIWAPPVWLFPPVAVVLAVAMGTASWLVWELGAAQPAVRVSLQGYSVQLGAGLLWWLAFFGLRQSTLALGVGLFWLIVLSTTAGAFYWLDEQAGLLLLPAVPWALVLTLLARAVRHRERQAAAAAAVPPRLEPRRRLRSG